MADLPRGLSATPPEGLSTTPPGLSTTPPPGLSATPPEETGRNRDQWYDDTILGELGEGVVSGGIGIVEGVTGLGASLYDYFADTDKATDVQKFFDDTRDVMGLDPEGFVGKGAEIVTQFVVPGLGAASMAGKLYKGGKTLSQLSKTQKVGLAASELTAAGAADAAVMNNGMTTIGDWVGFNPTETTDLIGLRGSERAAADLANRFKFGVESATLGGVAQAGLMKAGKTLGDSRIGKTSAAAIRDKIDNVGKAANELMYKRAFAEPGKELSKGKALLADVIAFGRYGGYLPDQIATKRLLTDGQVQIQVKEADRILKQFETGVDDFLKKAPEGTGVVDRVSLLNTVEDYLVAPDRGMKAQLLKQLPKQVRNPAIRMRKHIDRLTEDVLNSNFLKENNFVTKSGENLDDVIRQNINTYLRRRYKIFEDANYTPTAQSVKDADNFFRANKKATEKELTQMARKDTTGQITDEFLTTNGLARQTGKDGVEIVVTGSKVTDAAAQKAREGFLNRYSIKRNAKFEGGRMARDRLETGMFVSRENIPKTLRALLGEVKDPREAYLGTIADLAQFSAVDDYFGTIANLASTNKSIGNLFVKGDALTPAQKAGLRERGYVQLGGDGGKSSIVGTVGKEGDELAALAGSKGWGSIENYFVPQAIYDDLTRLVVAEGNLGAQVVRGIFSTFLRGKALSQYSKTILSPITQVRNATTAAAFATANGNIPVFGRGGSMADAAKAVWANISNKGPQAVFDDLADAQRRGVLGTNAELREIQDSLNRGIGLSARESDNALANIVGETVAKGVKKVTKPAEAVYQGSDDFWKYYSYHAEQGKLRHALRDATPEQQIAYLTKNGNDMSPEMASRLRRGQVDQTVLDDLIKDRAAQIVRDTVPNYNKAASELVSFARKLPVGNFITFPAEMFRTSFNIFKQSLDDIASDIPAVQARGRQRLLGFLGTTVVVPSAALNMGYAISGVDRDEMDAYKRSFAAPWEKGSVLIPIGKEDGKIQYINFSMSNPYDVISRAANRLLSETDNAIAMGKDPGQVMTDVVGGTLKEFLEPFLAEGMLTEAIIDTTWRSGRTSTGAEIWNPEDSEGAKAGKFLAHIFDTMVPNISPVDLKGEPGRFVRGTIGNFAPDLVSPTDKQGREREVGKELMRAFMGVTPLEFDPAKGLEYGAYRMGQAQTNAKRIFNGHVDDFNVTPNSLMSAFTRANDAKLRVDREYYQMFEDLKTMGMSNAQIARILKRNNIGGVDSIMRGKFDPFDLSKKNYQDLRDTGNLKNLPRGEIRRLQGELRGTPLAPDQGPRTKPPAPTPSRQPTLPPGLTPTPPAGLTTTPPGLTPERQGSLPQVLPTQARAPGPVNPALLGDNPIDAALNAQIANRQG